MKQLKFFASVGVVAVMKTIGVLGKILLPASANNLWQWLGICSTPASLDRSKRNLIL